MKNLKYIIDHQNKVIEYLELVLNRNKIEISYLENEPSLNDNRVTWLRWIRSATGCSLQEAQEYLDKKKSGTLDIKNLVIQRNFKAEEFENEPSLEFGDVWTLWYKNTKGCTLREAYEEYKERRK